MHKSRVQSGDPAVPSILLVHGQRSCGMRRIQPVSQPQTTDPERPLSSIARLHTRTLRWRWTCVPAAQPNTLRQRNRRLREVRPPLPCPGAAVCSKDRGRVALGGPDDLGSRRPRGGATGRAVDSQGRPGERQSAWPDAGAWAAFDRRQRRRGTAGQRLLRRLEPNGLLPISANAVSSRPRITYPQAAMRRARFRQAGQNAFPRGGPAQLWTGFCQVRDYLVAAAARVPLAAAGRISAPRSPLRPLPPAPTWAMAT